MASECEDDEIVIEETLRQSYFDWMDFVAKSIFVNGLEKWSAALRSGQVEAELQASQNPDKNKKYV